MENLYIGIEIGATKQQAALGTADGRLLHTITGKIPLPRGAQDVLDWLSAKVPELLRMEERFGGRVRSLAAGFGGEIESSTGRTLNSVQVPGWEDFPLRGWLEETFSMPAEVLNDTVSGGFSELYLGRGKEAGNVFYTNIGSGIGGAFFIDRVYYDGVGYGAAYFGNTYIPDWQSPEPGAMTRVEEICSGLGIERRLRRPGYVPAGSRIMEMCGGEPAGISCRMLEDAARAGDPFALEEVDRIARSYSIGLSNVLTLMSPELVIIGGGVAKMGDLLLDRVREYTDRIAFISCRGHYTIEQSVMMDDAVIAGAVYCAGHPELIRKGSC
ncbi:ROK family protein [Anaerotruncus massiliensis (ex Liu et al. 2021)]|uniref:ROK family protein n=2 Tax=Anaerotruncus TaxID=244127 RepID=A0A498CRZ8_9FIRM|nr:MULTISPECIES: ROK family protein [Anaerotruncus]MBC3938254.1 ROK family protein [Anaerotruncus massiliensis (ex Togo et al. 2019)]RLL12822.1 ROK family protein [Anaerotruncus massiliensis (ex Liu et al. 2021)]